MKSQSLTQAMSWLHTWGGLVFGWLLFAIFLTGTLAVFDKEIDVWMRPEAPAHKVDQTQAMRRALAYLQANHAQARAWNISLPTERSPDLTVSVGEQRRGGPRQYLDPSTGEPIAVRESAGGGHFFRFHFTLNMPRNIGIWLVGFAAIGMLVALFSSLIIHKKFFKEFFTFRPGKGQRSWLDAHNATGVLVLPFHLMITYSGLVIFSVIYMPAAVDALFDGDRQVAFGRDQHQQRSARTEEPATHLAQPTPIAPVLAEAERVMGEIGSLSISNPGRSDSKIELRPVLGNRIELTKGKSMVFDAVSAKVVRAPEESRGAMLTQRVIAGLHFAQFGGYPMRWLYFLCSLASCAMIATGLVLFTVKRRRKHDTEGPIAAWLYKAAERLNVAIIPGLSIACVGYLWGNRLLPIEMIDRGTMEVRVFFALWLLTLIHACLRPYMQAWREQLAIAAALCIALPMLSAITLAQPWSEPIRLYVELTTIACGLLLAFCAWRVGQPTVREAPRRQSASVAQV